MLSPKSRMGACFAALLPVMFTLAACGGGSSSSHKMNSASGAPKTTQGAGNQITATETEYHIQLSQMTLQPGATTFVAVNKGKVGHSLEINGPGVSNQRIAGTVSPGSSKPLTVTLQAGSYEIFCPIDGHKGLGMDVHITVGGGGSAGATTTNSGGAATTTTSGGGSTTSGGGSGY